MYIADLFIYLFIYLFIIHGISYQIGSKSWNTSVNKSGNIALSTYEGTLYIVHHIPSHKKVTMYKNTDEMNCY